MMRFSVRGKLFAGFGLALAMVVVLSVLGISRLGALNDKAARVGGELETSGQVVQLVRDGEEIHRTAFVGALALVARGQTTDAAEQKELLDQANEHLGELRDHIPAFDAALAKARRAANEQRERELLTGIATDWSALKPRLHRALAVIRKGDAVAAIQALLADDVDGTLDVMNGKIDALKVSVAKQGEDGVSEAASAYSSSRALLLVLALFAIAVVTAVAFVLSASLSRGFRAIADRLESLRRHDQQDLAEGMRAMADGDLSHPVSLTTEAIADLASDEIGDAGRSVNAMLDANGEMIDAYNAMRTSLAQLVGDIGSNAATLSSASQQMAATSEEAGRAVGEIASAVSDVAQGAERQIRKVESTRDAVQEAARAARASEATAQATAQAAENTRQLAREGVGAAEHASKAIEQVAASGQQVGLAIKDLSQRSERIGAIVDTITGIAEQTNLLALNAAIEAARAGEQGRGFAVVAEEVRKLAEESQTAAREISGLIREIQTETGRVVDVVADSTKRTDEGVTTVQRTREAFEQIGAAVEDMSIRVAEIATAVAQIAADAQRAESDVNEVAVVAEQSSASAEQVSTSTEETSASTQEIAASAQTLAGTATQLNDLVKRFTVTA
jgi:methyl-accepting chemotaxis protein